jgi:translation initiation factor 5
MKVHIGGDVNDVFWRYKRDQIRVQHYKTNGSETKLLNLSEIAKSLKCSEDRLVQYIKKNTGCTYANNRLRGLHSVQDIEKIIEKFVLRYILCPTCKLPELIKNQCQACGNAHCHAQKEKEKEPLSKEPLSLKESESQDKERKQAKELGKKVAKLMHLIYDLKNQEIRDRLLTQAWQVQTEPEYDQLQQLYLLHSGTSGEPEAKIALTSKLP